MRMEMMQLTRRKKKQKRSISPIKKAVVHLHKLKRKSLRTQKIILKHKLLPKVLINKLKQLPLPPNNNLKLLLKLRRLKNKLRLQNSHKPRLPPKRLLRLKQLLPQLHLPRRIKKLPLKQLQLQLQLQLLQKQKLSLQQHLHLLKLKQQFHQSLHLLLRPLVRRRLRKLIQSLRTKRKEKSMLNLSEMKELLPLKLLGLKKLIIQRQIQRLKLQVVQIKSPKKVQKQSRLKKNLKSQISNLVMQENYLKTNLARVDSLQNLKILTNLRIL